MRIVIKIIIIFVIGLITSLLVTAHLSDIHHELDKMFGDCFVNGADMCGFYLYDVSYLLVLVLLHAFVIGLIIIAIRIAQKRKVKHT